MKQLLPLLIFSLISFSLFSQTLEDKTKITKDYNIELLESLASTFKSDAELEKAKAIELAGQNNWPVRYEENGILYELMSVTVEGLPLYYITNNIDAGISTRANTLHNGGLLGLNIEGQNMEAHVWDGGLARTTHQEYDGIGGSNRFSIGDGTTSLHYHSAHVTGTIIASGFSANAKGMAPQAEAVGYEWNNDVSEATTAATGGMLLSNHSYGWGASGIPDWYFGAYNYRSREWDVVMNNAEYYLMVCSAGNDGNDNSSNGDPLDGNSSYDKLSGFKTTKNNMVVANGQDANIDANGDLISVVINSGSSEGPCDDYRIKPDIAGNGTSLYSSYEGADNEYGTISGTSMASPNVTGTLLLLQQHYNNLNAGFMRAATLKGLALHTADDSGPAGPDAVFGWGLINGKVAAQTISTHGNESEIRELTLSNGGSYSFNVTSDGVNDLIASISWNDPAGTANTGTANDPTPVLVNDLDIRVTQGGSTYYPYRLTSITTNNTGDNDVDPFEKIIVSGASGTYTVTVTHKGSLSGGSQDYSLIVTGLAGGPAAPVANFTADDVSPSVGQTVNFTDLTSNLPTSWSWSFSPSTVTYVGGTNSLSKDPQVTFDVAGSYTVTLTATNAQGNDTEVKTNYITAAYQATATYTSGDIQTDYSFQSLPGSSSCPGSLSVTIPAGATITGTDVEYEMTAFSSSNAWMSEQRSELRCVSAGGASEGVLSSGSGNSAGTYSYGRTGLTIANGVTGGGNINFELHAGRTWGGSGCNTTYNIVDNNTWTITVYYTPGSGCTYPTTQASSFGSGSITSNSMTVSWTRGNGNNVIVLAREGGAVNADPSDGSSYTANAAFGSGSQIGTGNYVVYNGTGTSVNVTGLSASTTYHFAAYEYNTSGYCYLVPALTGNATTGSGGGGCISSFPYTQSFDGWSTSSPAYNCTADGSVTLQDDWTNVTGDDIDWDILSGSTGSSNTGPSSDHTSGSGNYLYTETSSCYNNTGYITSPCFDFSALSDPQLTFWYHMYGSAMGTMSVQVSTNGGSSWSADLWSLSGNQTNNWYEATVNLSAYASVADVIIRWTGATGTSYTSDMAIDDVTVDDVPSAPSCTTPVSPLDGAGSVALSGSLQWNSVADATGYKIWFGTDGGGTVDPTNILNGTNLGNTTSYFYSGLPSSTTFFWKIVPYNANGDAIGCSIWSFTTVCNTIASFPWTEDFENGGLIPSCWSNEYVVNALDWSFQSGGYSSNPPSAHGGSYNAYLFKASSARDVTKLVTPELDLSGLTAPALTFWHTQALWPNDQDSLRVYYKTSSGGSWTLLQSWTDNITSWTEETIILPNTSSTYYIAFEGAAQYGYGVCIDDVSVLDAFETEMLWTGAVDNDWNDVGNWSGSLLPAAANNLTIPGSPSGGNFPETNSGSGVECNDLTIQTGAHLHIPADKSMTVNGTLTNHNGPSGLVIKSTSNSATGSLIHSTPNVEATVEKYVTHSQWHFIGSPVESEVAGVFKLSGGHSDVYLKTHDEATNTWGDWIVPVSTPLERGRGYEVWVGNAGFAQDEVFEFDGELNAGDLTTGAGSPTFYDLQYTSGRGLNLIANPYPSALEADIDTWTKTNIDNSVWVWTGISGSGGNYRYWNGTDGTNSNGWGTLDGGIIPAMQAFFVLANSSNPSLTIPQSNRVHSAQAYYKDDARPNTIRLDVEGNGYSDAMFVSFNLDATEGYDGQFDVFKLYGLYEAPQLYSIVPGEILSINSLPQLEDYTNVQLGFECDASETFTIEASELESFEENLTIYLEDTKEAILHNLSETNTYYFDHQAGDDPQRFILHFGAPNNIPELTGNHVYIYSFEDVIFIKNPNRVNGKVRVYDLIGQEIHSESTLANEIIEVGLNVKTGYYMVTFESESFNVSQKVLIK